MQSQLAAMLGMSPGAIRAILEEVRPSQRGRDPSYLWSDIEPLLRGAQLRSARKELRRLRMQPHGSRYWVAGHPHLVAQWHPTKNGELLPDEVSYGSGRRVWWKCPVSSDHEWAVPPRDRTANLTGCPFCACMRVSRTNSLANRAPQIARQWHPTRNGALTPSGITVGSTRRVWWKCPVSSDHEWAVAPRVRAARKGTGCPFCEGLRVSRTNSLAACAPAIAKQWHPTRNGDLTPAKIVVASAKKVWWRCSKSDRHVWASTVVNRTVWWQCERFRTHAWKAAVGARANGSGCPFCAGKRTPGAGPNYVRRFPLSTASPELARQWHPTRNGNLTPADVTAGSSRKMWWRCAADKRHEWFTSVAHRVLDGQGCPYCANKRVSATNSLAARAPALARQWHPRLNGKLLPTDVTARSGRRVFLRCPANPRHAWQTTVNQRTGLGSGCPHCERE